MTDTVTNRLVDARTLVIRAAVEMNDGEAKMRVHLALAALGDALEQHAAEREMEEAA